MIFNKQEISKIDLNFFESELAHFPYLYNTTEHYRLLVYLSQSMNNKLILDLGTAQGHSALALSQNQNNKIITYDLKKMTDLLDYIPNIERKLLDVNKEELTILESADLILLDIDPHDGIQEQVFVERLNQTNFKGILLCDDVFLNDGMKTFWNGITREKYDLTEIGHFSGTGLVNYSGQNIILK